MDDGSFAHCKVDIYTKQCETYTPLLNDVTETLGSCFISHTSAYNSQ